MLLQTNDRFLRIKDIVGNRSLGIKGYIPISKSSWWAGVASGKYPKPIKLGPRTSCWKEADIMRIINSY